MNLVELFPNAIAQEIESRHINREYPIEFQEDVDDICDVKWFETFPEYEQRDIIKQVLRTLFSDNKLLELQEAEEEFEKSVKHLHLNRTDLRLAWNDQIEFLLGSHQIADEQIY